MNPLLSRSHSLERTAKLYEAVEDVERALQEKSGGGGGKVNLAIRGECCLVSLFLKFHICQLILTDSHESYVCVPLTGFAPSGDGEEIVRGRGRAYTSGSTQKPSWKSGVGTSSKRREVRDPFERLSPELFLKFASLCDSPSLAISTAVSKTWRESILRSTGLFSDFKMVGNGPQIVSGIELFSTRCEGSIRIVEVEIKDALDSSDQESLQAAIPPSRQSLKHLSLRHQGDLCKIISSIAAEIEDSGFNDIGSQQIHSTSRYDCFTTFLESNLGHPDLESTTRESGLQ